MEGLAIELKILYLEDELTIASVTIEYMKMKEYQVTHVTDGESAMERLKEEKFSLVILDIMVPGTSGLDVLAYIHQKELGTPVIMLSALEDEGTQINAFNLFADDYITKPFSPILLLKRIEAVLRRKEGVRGHSLTSGIELRELSYEVWFNNQSLQFTVTEYLLFQLLYQHPTQVFTREQLLNHVFADDYYPNDRVIDAHIKNIRKKLPENVIKTVIGLGYQYEAH
ncbi:response regulator transcription factor [uncultured Vagococcus sp.]|uniref:response regulator transcription factor n=1 Tax=uncultured Vagococcus sp. TaxID=189676 RepID=UPI0028D33143|nr:response regulator transcription factor [uncultured Vagococcus sp.]